MRLLPVILFLTIILTGCRSMEDKIDNLFSEYNKPGMPGAAVMVIKDGKVLLQKGYGFADIEKGKSVTASTNFRLASVTKQFTAMCILMLVEEGKLRLDTNLKEIFPAYHDYGSSVTIKQLLQHTSGLYDYEDMIDDSVTIQLKDKDVLSRMMTTKKTYFETGSQHRYSNTGYALLSLIVEKISGVPFGEYLKKKIFEPLDMKNTIAFENGINEVTNRAFGYSVKNDKAEISDQSITSAVLGDGGIYSSINDLYKWDQSLYSEKLISKKFLEESWERGVTCEGTFFPYGYGWHIEKWNGNKVVYHTGSTRGFRNIIYRMPDKKTSIIILTNRNEGEEKVTLELAHQIAEWVLDE